jgi:copper chaperone CopZ
MTSVTFRIEGLRSAGCADTVRALLCAEAGVYAVDVSLERAEARVFYDTSLIDRDRLIALIETPGYRVMGGGP